MLAFVKKLNVFDTDLDRHFADQDPNPTFAVEFNHLTVSSGKQSNGDLNSAVDLQLGCVGLFCFLVLFYCLLEANKVIITPPRRERIK